MRKREVVKHAREVLERDFAAISDGYPDMPGEGQDWQTINYHLYELRSGGISGFFPAQSSPRPATDMVKGAFKDLFRDLSQSRLRFVGESVLPHAETPDQTPSHKIRDTARHIATACSYAEDGLSGGLKQVKTEGYYEQDLVSVYHDNEGQPLLFRKSYDESTALSLVPLAWGGITVPAGTIMTVDKKMSRSSTGEVEGSNFTMATYLVPRALTVTPVRLSAWAYEDPRDRALFALTGPLDSSMADVYYAKSRATAIENNSLADFVEAAHKVIELCVD